MKNPVAIFAGTTVIAVIAAVIMWRELRTERQISAELRTQLAEARLLPPAAVAAVPAREVPPPLASAPAAAENKPADAPAAPVPAVLPASLQDALSREQALLRDPEYRKARQAQQRLSLERSYPGLAEALGLSSSEAGRLFDLLAEKQMDMSAEFPPFSAAGRPDQAALQERARRQQVFQQQQEEAVRALLGDSKYALWQDYQPTRGPRMQAGDLGSQLAQAGLPLSDAQQRSLTNAFIGEQQRQRQESQIRPPGFNASDPQARMQMMEESLRRQEESNRRILDAAASSLNSQQLAALRQQYESQMAMSRASMRVERSRLESQGSQAQPSGAVPIVGPTPMINLF